MVLSPERVRAQLSAQRGGADVVFDAKGQRTGGARLMAVVTLQPGETGRHYRLPTDRDYEVVHKAQQRIENTLEEWKHSGNRGICPVPDEPTPVGGGSGAGRAFSVQKYGMLRWGDLFTARQKLALNRLAGLAREGAKSNSEALREAVAMILGRCVDYNSSGVIWAQAGEFVAHTFGRQALPIV